MSARATHWALQQTTELPVDKLILIALADFADDTHSCWPSRKKLALIGMCSVDTVDRAIKRLSEAGMVTKVERTAERGGLTSNCYTLCVDAQAPSRTVRPPLAAECPHPQPQPAATLAASDAATLAAQDAATGIKNLTANGTKYPPSGAPKTNDASRGSRLDADWHLPDDWRQWTRTTFPQSTDASVTETADTFRDFWHAKAGKDGRKADWQATWRNWCRRAFATAPLRPHAQPSRSASDREVRMAAFKAALAKRREEAAHA